MWRMQRSRPGGHFGSGGGGGKELRSFSNLSRHDPMK
jgi:hypothetical protein